VGSVKGPSPKPAGTGKMRRNQPFRRKGVERAKPTRSCPRETSAARDPKLLFATTAANGRVDGTRTLPACLHAPRVIHKRHTASRYFDPLFARHKYRIGHCHADGYDAPPGKRCVAVALCISPRTGNKRRGPICDRSLQTVSLTRH
jgi:hypothetical protein